MENLTLAMEVRAFHGGLERTNFHKLEFQKRDYIAGIFYIVLLLLNNIIVSSKIIYFML